MKKMIIAVVLCVALTACACFSWMFAKSDIQCLLFLILALFPYPLFEEGRKEYRNSKVGGGQKMKLDAVDRMAVESIRHANTVRITINEGQKDERSFVFDQSRGDFTAFRRGLRLTTQDYIRDCMRERSRSLILN